MVTYFHCHFRVLSLFTWKPDDMTSPEPSFFSFKAIIENPKMKVSIFYSVSKFKKRAGLIFLLSKQLGD